MTHNHTQCIYTQTQTNYKHAISSLCISTTVTLQLCELRVNYTPSLHHITLVLRQGIKWNAKRFTLSQLDCYPSTTIVPI